MKNILITLSIIFLFIVNISQAATVNGRFVVLTNDGTDYIIKLQINTDTGTDDMGGATIIFNFSNVDLSIAMSSSTDVSTSAYTFHNFSGGNYSTATITRPLTNQLWLNIELNNDNNGTVVTQSPSWTDVVTISFSTVNSSGSSNLVWQTGNSNWSIFDGNNSTEWTIGTFTNENTSPLPVELSSFTASVNRNAVNLIWQTATEINNYGFEIEKLQNYKNAKLQDSKWEKIGFVAGSGNSNSTKDYSFMDKNLIGGSKFAYRLKQVDNDGTFSYSDEIEVEVIPDKYELYQNYPNPFNPVTNIKFSLPEAAKVRIDIFNIIGEKVKTLIDQNMETGFHAVTFNAESLTSGTYIYRLQTDNFTQIKKMLLLK